MLLPPTLLTLLHFHLHLALSHASPQPPLITSDYEMSLLPRHTLFLRQVSNLQTFSGELGGAPAAPITNSGDQERPFSVEGDTFDTFESAAQRSCDNQFNACAQAANSRNRRRQDGGLSVQACSEQKDACNAAQQNAQVKDFTNAVASTNIGPDPEFPDFDLICEG
ncbi:hypothetical protein BDW02DRAFT_487414 [Decorospora gaudefroyi]|uniref:Uncharacterized protein n=1 Tax=Decorospora gaudefroyi TaxID=184978 RepID=A0A6A5KPU2_9PLEO|nr:hypothetical protein BDW02DRAFT_487414 [Decorospora gaudefroyi]